MRTPNALAALFLFGCTDPTGDTPRPPAKEDTDTAPDTAPDTGPAVAARNVIVILSDDQAFNTMWAMPEVSARVLPAAVSFEKAYVGAPMCCPMRASFLSGGWYPKDTGVLTNNLPMGGASAFPDSDTLATRLQSAGVATALFGKYMNNYEVELAPYVPPGWDTWVATGAGDGGYEQEVVVGSSGPNASSVGTVSDTGGEHYTSYLFDQALAFVDAEGDRPYFLYLAPNSPHLSGSPATEDLALYADLPERPPSFDEEDISDKPLWLQEEPRFTELEVAGIDYNARRMYQNLASLDREVADFVDALAARGTLEDTLVVYASDNGYLHGEHRLEFKGLPYEEAVHVPLFALAPGVTPRVDSRLVSVNLDLAATVTDLLGAPASGEGSSLRHALADPTVATRDHVFIDNYTSGFAVWAAIVTEQYKYVEWGTGETEIYDVVADPFELTSLHAAPPADAHLIAWGTMVDEHRGLSILEESVPSGEIGVPYRAHITTWGGTAPVILSLEGPIPPGLTFGGGGVLEGTPTQDGEYVFNVIANDASASGWTGEPQSYSRALRLVIGEEPEEPSMARSTETSATLVIHARPGVAVRVEATPERVPEGPRRVSETVVTGADGRVVLTIEGLREELKWYWVAFFDGTPAAHGDIPAPAGPY